MRILKNDVDLRSTNHKHNYVMKTKNITVSVDLPKSYQVGLLQEQLTIYAQLLIAQSKPKKRHRRHEALCGIFKSNASEEELIEEYLQDKY